MPSHFLASVFESVSPDDFTAVTIGDKEASEIAYYIFGIHPCYWPLQSSNACGLPAFQKYFATWKTCWESNVASGWECACGAIRKLYREMRRKNKLSVHIRNSHHTPSDTADFDFVDAEPTDEERRQGRAKWLTAYNLNENIGRQLGNSKHSKHAAFQFKPNIRANAMAAAAEHWEKEWNKAGTPLDCLLEAGRQLRECFGAPIAPDNRESHLSPSLCVKASYCPWRWWSTHSYSLQERFFCMVS